MMTIDDHYHLLIQGKGVFENAPYFNFNLFCDNYLKLTDPIYFCTDDLDDMGDSDEKFECDY